MRHYLPGFLLAGFLCGCGGAVPKEPAQQSSSVQQESVVAPRVGDPCEIKDSGGKAIDTCLPDQTGLHCCLVGPSYYGFCIDGPDVCV